MDNQFEPEQPSQKKLRVEKKQSRPSSSDYTAQTPRASTDEHLDRPFENVQPSAELRTEKPSAVFRPRNARDWTLTMAIPGSILNNVARHDMKTLLVGRIARTAAVWCVDEIVVYDDDPENIPEKVSKCYRGKKKTKKEVMDSISEVDIPYQNPDRFMVGLLEYAECPPHIRSAQFPMCEPLKYAGLLPPLDHPSHTKPDEWIRFREGHVPEMQPNAGRHGGNQTWTYVDCGLPGPVRVPCTINGNQRVTLKFNDPQPASWPHLTPYECENLDVEAVRFECPRVEGGYYWGYTVRYAASLSAAFTETEHPGGYNFIIGTSERGVPLSSILPDAIAPRNRPTSNSPKLPDSFKHIQIVFGGVSGLEPVVANDKNIGLDKENAHNMFDYWVNLVEGQGSRTIRTEEAIEIGLAGLKSYVDYQYEQSP